MWTEKRRAGAEMGKRLRGRPGRASSSPLDGLLGGRIASSSKHIDLFDVGAVVEHLRSRYPSDYSRIKLQPFTFRVRRILESYHSQKKTATTTTTRTVANEEEDSDEGRDGLLFQSPTSNPSPKRSCKTDLDEDRLLRTESEHLRRNRKQWVPAPSSPLQTSTSSPASSYSSSDEDVVFEEKVDPEFDLMKSMLRENYVKPQPVVGDEEKNLEVENTVGRPRRTVGSSVDGSGTENPVYKNGNGGEELVKGKDGPRFKDLGGIQGVLEELMMEVIVPLYHPQLPKWLGVRPMAGILLHGPPGCGKTKLAHAIANETGVPFYKISATEVVSGVSGASEENIRDLFKKAYRTAPSIVFIDEIDAIASKRENLQREMERRIVTQLMTCMDESHQTLGSVDADSDSETSQKKPGYVLVIGATNRPDAVDQALRRPGRFDREIVLGVPDENARLEILTVLIRGLRLDGTFDLWKIARSTPGFVGADLAALVNKAGNLAMKRIIDTRKCAISRELQVKDKSEEWWRRAWAPEEMERLNITMTDFEEATKMVQPSSRREGFSSIPNVKWDDVGGLNTLRKEFDRYIVKHIKNPEDYEEFGVTSEAGFLLYGPPGCGKTLIAKAVANEAGANFIHVKGPELLNKYVGESELAVRTIFSRARTCSPCILFFDEVDALTTKRGKEGGWVVERLLNQLLIELDGADQRRGVYVIGATNRVEVVDPAILRPGRFGKVMYVPLPSAEERVQILKALAKTKPIAADVDLGVIGQREACENLSGADLSALMNEAAMAALEEKQMHTDQRTPDFKQWVIKASHFEQALQQVKPSVSEKQRIYYNALSQNFQSSLNGH